MIISPTLPRRVLATVVAVGALTVVATPVALAHDSVIGGNPADGDVVEEFPRSIEPRNCHAPDIREQSETGVRFEVVHQLGQQ